MAQNTTNDRQWETSYQRGTGQGPYSECTRPIDGPGAQRIANGPYSDSDGPHSGWGNSKRPDQGFYPQGADSLDSTGEDMPRPNEQCFRNGQRNAQGM